MKPESAIERSSVEPARWSMRLDPLRDAARDWVRRDAPIWLHLAKTVFAALLAMGIAMRLQMSQPRTAMTTVFVLMQPLSGMVFAKSFYRVLGTAAGLVAALALGGLFAQQPELYMAGLTLWIGGCIALAVRNRHFRWYGFVLAGYTAALIGLPAVTSPHTLFESALTRAAEVALGIACSGAVSALILPLSSAGALMRSLRARDAKFAAFTAGVLAREVVRGDFERRFADFVDDIVGFEANRAFASFEDPHIRARSRRLARLNSEFMNACTRLHALHQLVKRLRASRSDAVLDALAPHVAVLAQRFAALRDEAQRGIAPATGALLELRRFHGTLPKAARASRRAIEDHAPGSLLDFDTAIELMYRFIGEYVGYADTYASLDHDAHAFERSVTHYAVKTNAFFVGFTWLRTVVAVGAMSAFWLASEWPSGALAVIATAIACALSSMSPRAPTFVAQMGVGAAFATAVGYLFLCDVYPNIDGFPLLCAALAPVLGVGAFLAMRPGLSGYGVGFAVFFCLLAGPDNTIVYTPDVLINNGLAIVVAMLACAIVFAVVFPTRMRWLVGRIAHDLRGQVALACEGARDGLAQRFQSSTHDLMAQLRTLLERRTRQHRDALRWMLSTLEIGHAVIDLRDELHAFCDSKPPQTLRWTASIDAVLDELPRFFDDPTPSRHARTLKSVNLAIRAAQHTLHAWYAVPDARRRMQRIVGCLHFMRSALLDSDAPFNRQRR
ncbi:FUSC family protein [Burkholderia dolosa]|uniref:FUSC family protein n=1 Tax=Burkholderia dolosa TaxID=152500 RepID=UPI001B985AB7|nr:FUSC family protein [Burkholderia dolosa]MBR8059635.1 FUSC family protein [Burkholderia dolosa]